MGEHDCIQEEKIGAMMSTLNRIDKQLFNGDGLVKTIPVLSTQVENLREGISDLRIAVSGLNKFMDETKGSQNTFKNVAPWVSIMVAVIAIAVSVIVKINFNKENERINSQLQYKQDRSPNPATRSLTPEQVKAMSKQNNTTVK